jgi:hypothetical protein
LIVLQVILITIGILIAVIVWGWLCLKVMHVLMDRQHSELALAVPMLMAFTPFIVWCVMYALLDQVK